MNITEFLEARIAEDEAELDFPGFVEMKSIRGPGWGYAECPICQEDLSDGTEPVVEESWWQHAEDVHRRARVLAECAAKRAIVGSHGKSCDYASEYRKPTPLIVCLECGPHEDVDWRTNGSGNFPCPTLRHLAAVYDQHPDYDPAWRNA